MQYQQQTAQPSRWLGNGLFDCFSDCTSCCVTCWVPCITYAENGVMLRGGDTSTYWADFLIYLVVLCFTGCQCVLGMARRTDIRRKYNLPDQPCNDCCVHCCCHGCALCQENRELKVRMSTGAPMTGAPPVGAPYASAPTPATYGAPQYPQEPAKGVVV